MSVKLTCRPKVRSRWSFSPRLERLEDRRVLACVTSNQDSGPGTLRQLILDANSNPDHSIITFCTGPTVIKPLFPGLPAITQPATIDGTAGGACSASVPTIILDGFDAGQSANGLLISAGGSVVRGLNINTFGASGIRLVTQGNNTLECNFIGTDDLGSVALPNALDGIRIEASSSNNVIGGTNVFGRNIVSGNVGIGISVASQGNLIKGNFIGLDRAGTISLGNQGSGLVIGGSANTIGGTTVAERNIISGNLQDGIQVQAGQNNVIIGNFVGTDVGGTVASLLGNGGNGITLGGTLNCIGGIISGSACVAANGTQNLLSGNNGNGLSIAGDKNTVIGNKFGTDRTGTVVLPNFLNGIAVLLGGAENVIGGTLAAERNLISGNLTDGISLAGNANIIRGNFIGSDIGGTIALPNGTINNTNSGYGIRMTGSFAVNNEIGGTILDAGDVNVARNLISGNLKDGIILIGGGASFNTIRGNFIGTDVTGTTTLTDVSGTIALSNKGNGITLLDGAHDNLIGGTIIVNLVHASRNVISGNEKVGIHMLNLDAFRTTNNKVEGNYIGTDVGGTLPLSNNRGVSISGAATSNTIGGTIANARNLISGNTVYGVGIFDRFTSNNKVTGNYIGTDVTGTLALANGDGVHLFGAASKNTIGGTIPRNQIGDFTNVSRNLISGNTNAGVRIYDTDTSANNIQGNYIGTDVTGTLALANGNGVQFDGGATANILGGTIVDGDIDPNQPPNNNLLASSRNVISGNAGYGVGMLDSHTSLNRVEGNFIGTDISGIKAPTDLTGTIAMSNQIGVSLYNGANGNIIGGTVVVDDINRSANVISANLGDGVEIWGKKTDSNVVLANLIGTDLSGTLALGNGARGIYIYFFAATNQIGWLIDPADIDQTIVVAGNTIVHHPSHGIWITEGATRNVLYGNFIGTDAGDNLFQPNLGHGILISTINFDKKATDNVVGSNISGRGNTIRFNGDTVAGVGDGVRVDSGGFSGFAAARNAIRGNHISDNVGRGIDLVGTPQGGNLMQKAPDITSVIYDGINVSVHFELNNTVAEFVPNRQYNLDFFISPGTVIGADCDGLGVGAEGEFYRISKRVTTDVNGDYSSVTTPPMPQPVLIPLSFLQPNSVVTTTVTDRSGNTSEFSLCMPIPPFPMPTAPPERPSTPVVADLHLNRPGADIIVTLQAKAQIWTATRAGDGGGAVMANENDFAEPTHRVVQRNRARERAPETSVDSNDFLMIDL